jgi:tRNA nucleotidyltransferase (CCA-adding enzyme)
MLKYISKFKFIKNKFKYLIKMEQISFTQSQINCNQNLSNMLLSKFDCKNLFTYEHLKPTKVLHQITLNQKETEIFEIIKSVLKKNNRKTICRVAGGWVRDKLLGKNSDDIDIALDDMKGEEMAKMINSELYPGQDKYGVVEKNSEKSKHLETATMIISGISVDFVNLRSEKYTETSRVPIIDIGTPQEDAMRRDITINSMFYNINENCVEDFLGNGLEDLTNGYIRTPMNPTETFADDPLRILRVIRFAVRFQFNLDLTIEKASSSPEIKAALYQKISNERIAKELSLMLDGNKPQCALYLIYKYNILDAVMKLPISIYEAQNDCLKINSDAEKIDLITSLNLSIIGSYLLEKCAKSLSIHHSTLFLTDFFKPFKPPNKKMFFLSLMTLPFMKYSIKVLKEILKADAYIIRESLKLPNEYVREISIISENLISLIEYVNKGIFDRLSSAKLVRKIKSQYLYKLTAVTICYEYLNQSKSEIRLLEFIDTTLFDEICLRFEKWYQFLERENLLKIDELEPILKGDMIREIFKANGKEIGILLESLIEKQISQPNLSKDEAITFLHKKRDEFSVDCQNEGKKGNKKTKSKNKK